MYFYNARFYDATLGRFAQADTIIPGAGNPLALDRYAYVQNNSLRYTDPTGHWRCGDHYDPGCIETNGERAAYLSATGQMASSGESFRVLQVDLEEESRKQFDMIVFGKPGYMACPIAAGLEAGASLEEMTEAAKTNGFSKQYGMQPSQAADAYRQVYGSENVTEYGILYLIGIYDALERGEVVLVDMLVKFTGGKYIPSTDGGVSHFARVLGMDWNAREVYVQNTLRGRGVDGDSYWTISFDDFNKSRLNPEFRSDIYDNNEHFQKHIAEKVWYWGVTITPLQ